jgi:hypothetical protein
MPTVNGGLGSLQMGDPFVHSAMLASVALGAPTSTMFQTQGSGLNLDVYRHGLQRRWRWHSGERNDHRD